MIVPDYWAEARRQHRQAGRQVTVHRFGWSALSAEDAAAMAESRASEALRRIEAGEKLIRREPKVPYNGADGVPIREEVLARSGEDVITRNAYGARCLNTPDALFADVDFEPRDSLLAAVFTFLALAFAAVASGLLSRSWSLGAALFFAALVLAAPVAHLLRRTRASLQGGPEAQAKKRLKQFLTTHPDWNVRLYRTPAGLRLLVTHRPFSPADQETREFLQSIGADPVYIRMCLSQQCFRARLTAKPWRIGIATHMRPRPGTWPVAPERMSQRTAWVGAYEERAKQFAACRYIESVGSGHVSARLQQVIALHDQESRAHNQALAIA